MSRKFLRLYGLAILTVVFAVMLRLALDPVLGERLPLATLFAAVLLIAWHGGRGPAAVTLLLGLAAVAYFILEPRNSLSVARGEDVLVLAYYLLIGGAAILVIDRLHLARSRAERSGADAQQKLLELQRESLRRQQAESAAAAEAERFRITLASVGDGVITTDAEGRVTFLNEVASTLTGWAQAEAQGRPLEEVFRIVNEISGEPVANPVDIVLREGAVVGLANHTLLLAKDGSGTPIDDSAAPIRNADGTLLGVVLIFRAVAAQRKAQRELEASNALRRSIIDFALDCIITMDHEGKIVEFNPAAEQAFGYRRADAIGRDLASLIIPPALRERHARGLAHYLATGEAPVMGKRIEISALHASGSEFMVELAITRLPGEPPLFTAYLRDISARLRAQQQRGARQAATQALNQATTIPDGALAVVKAVCENLDWEVGSFWNVGPSGKLECLQTWHNPAGNGAAFAERSRALILSRGEGLPGRVLESGAPAWIADLRVDGNFPRLPSAIAAGLHSAFAYPVVADGNVVGVFEFFSPAIREPDANLLEMMGTVAGNFAQFHKRQLAEAAIRQYALELSDFFENATVGLHWVGSDGTILRANRAELDMLGYRSEEYVGHSIAEFHADAQAISDILSRLRAGEELRQYPARLRCRDGSIKDVLIDSSAMIRDGAFIHSRCFTRDVTEARHAEQALRQSEQKLQLLADTIPQLAWMARPDGHIFWYNRRWYEYTGTTPAQMEGWGWQSVHDPDQLPHVVARWTASLETGQPFEMVFPLRSAEGEFRAFLTRVNPLRDERGEITYWFGTNTDVEAQQRASRALAQSEERFRQLADAMPQIVWTAGSDGRIDYLNRRWFEYTGLPQGVSNEGWSKVLHPEDAPAARARWAESLAQGTPFDMEFRVLDGRTGEYRWHLVRTVPVCDEHQVVRWFGTATDINEQKRAEETSRYLAEASAELASVVDYEATLQKVANLAVPYFSDWAAVDMANEDGTLRRLAVAHRDAAKIALVRLIEQEYPSDPEAETGAYGVLKSGQPQIFSEIPDELLVKATKDERHLELIRSLGLKSYICAPLQVAGKTIGTLTFATAESGRRYSGKDLELVVNLAGRASIAIENAELYRALREADRRKDEFLATLAHELRNPLAPISNSLQIVKMPNVEPSVIERSRAVMERQVNHLVRLVDDLLDVSRVTAGKIELHKEPIALAATVARAVEMVQPLLDSQNQHLTLNLPEDPLIIEADPLRIAQVIGNLLTNAAKYSHQGSRIELSAEREGDCAVLRVRDEGIGIAPSMLSRIFQIFVQADHATTRAQGGLGIGLTLARNLVRMHQGSIEAHSEGLGKGSEFVVRLPLADHAAVRAAPIATAQDTSASHESSLRLMVVDDNEDAAMTLHSLLTLHGHEVRAAYSGRAALEMSAEYKPHVVFLDLGMPEMDGLETARRLRRQPGLEQVILVAVTGWGQPDDRKRTAAAGFNHHLVKPPEPAALQEILRSVRPGQ